MRRTLEWPRVQPALRVLVQLDSRGRVTGPRPSWISIRLRSSLDRPYEEARSCSAVGRRLSRRSARPLIIRGCSTRGDWVLLGNADEQKPAAVGTVEAWGRAPDNPVGGWYGIKMGLRGRFANYVPPVLEKLGLAEVEHNARNNRMRAI